MQTLRLTTVLTLTLLLALTGCSSGGGREDEDVQPDAANPSELSFGAETRTDDVGEGLTEGQFKVCAWTRDVIPESAERGDSVIEQLFIGYRDDGGAYVGDRAYTRRDGSWRMQQTYYWPRNFQHVDFYAVYPVTDSDLTLTPQGSRGPNRYTLHHMNDNHDLYVACSTWQKDDVRSTDGRATLKFRHALCQVGFKAKRTSTAPDIDVTISSIQLVNIRRGGTFTYGAMTGIIDTRPMSKDGHEPRPLGTDEDDVIGTWTSDGEEQVTYDFGLTAPVTLADLDSIYTLAGTANPQLLIPQQLTPWDPATETDVTRSQHVYLKIGCSIQVNSPTDTYGCRFDDEDYVYLPLSGEWLQGKNYTYTLGFGGGYARDGHLILTPITLTCDITPWQTATGYVDIGKASQYD